MRSAGTFSLPCSISLLDKFRVIKDRETLSLGDRTLEFILTPWTHWPETQVTYLREDRILFPCDLFGYHTATSDLFVTDRADFYIPGKAVFCRDHDAVPRQYQRSSGKDPCP